MIQKKSLKEAIQNPEIISVVGELLSPFIYRGVISATDENLSNATEEGVYITSQPSDSGTGPNDHGMLLVGKNGTRLIIQTIFTIRGKVYQRFYSASSSSWNKFTEIIGTPYSK